MRSGPNQPKKSLRSSPKMRDSRQPQRTSIIDRARDLLFCNQVKCVNHAGKEEKQRQDQIDEEILSEPESHGNGDRRKKNSQDDQQNWHGNWVWGE